MANLIQFLNKSKSIDAKCEALADKLIQDYQNGIIKTETELFYRLKQAIKEFYASIGNPTFKFKPAKSTPMSADYNDMVASACTDLKTIIEESTNLSDAITNSFTDTELARQMMFNKMLYINRKLDDIKNRIIINNSSNIKAYTDSFTNKDFAELPKDIPAFINTVDGVLTLGTVNPQILSANAKVEILPGSNGFPGSTHQADILDNDMHFVGETSMHMDLNDIIDNNSDTWFEYELFNMEDDIVAACNGFGFNYKEGIPWVVDDNSLKLRLKITLNNPSECNWLSLTPFIPETKEAQTAFITKCIISDGNAQVQEIKEVKAFDDNTVITFNPQVVSYVILELEQNVPYNVNVGHFYFAKTDDPNILIFDGTDNAQYSRVEGENPSVELLNMQYDPATKQCVNPKNYNDDPKDTFIDEAYVKKELFTQPSDTSKVKVGKEMLPAYRYCIGIKTITLAKYTFVPQSIYISKTFEENEPITSITLEADELIPAEFNTGLAAIDLDKWLTYEISLDGGTKWNPIYPKQRSFQGPCTFKINSEIPKVHRSANVRYMDTLIDPTSVKLRITLSRPNTIAMSTKTPVVFAYRLKILTGVDSVEY